MRLAGFRNLLLLWKSFGKLPVAEDPVPDDHALTRLGVSANHIRTDEDVPRADVAMENAALDDCIPVTWRTTSISQRQKERRSEGLPVMQCQMTCRSCSLDVMSVDERHTSATTIR